jgi:hypothetical protein
MYAFWIIGLGLVGMALGSLINTFVGLLLAAIGVLAGFKIAKAGNDYRASNAATPTPSKAIEPLEIPITVKVTYETSVDNHRGTADEDRDAWEGSFWEVQEPVTCKAKLRFNYTDATGRKTERTVDVRQMGGYVDTTLLIGHCSLRDATRTFRTDRITNCVDVDTGEVVKDVVAHLKKRYEESPEHSRDTLLEEEYDTLRVLLYMGKADGQLRAAEKLIIRETCASLASDSRMTDATIDDMFNTMDVPTLQAFKLAVGRLAKREQTSRDVVLGAAEKMIATQKTIHPAEQEAIDYMRKRFAVADPKPA